MKLHFRPALALSLILVIFLTSLGLTVTAQAQTYSASSGIEYDHFIIYKGADGDTVCREATLAEKRELDQINPKNLRQFNHLDNALAMSAATTENAEDHLTIILQATTNLDSSPLAKAAFARAAAGRSWARHRWRYRDPWNTEGVPATDTARVPAVRPSRHTRTVAVDPIGASARSRFKCAGSETASPLNPVMMSPFRATRSRLMATNPLSPRENAIAIAPLIELIGVIWTMGIVAAVGTVGPIICYAVPVFRQIDHGLEEFQTSN